MATQNPNAGPIWQLKTRPAAGFTHLSIHRFIPTGCAYSGMTSSRIAWLWLHLGLVAVQRTSGSAPDAIGGSAAVSGSLSAAAAWAGPRRSVRRCAGRGRDRCGRCLPWLRKPTWRSSSSDLQPVAEVLGSRAAELQPSFGVDLHRERLRVARIQAVQPAAMRAEAHAFISFRHCV